MLKMPYLQGLTNIQNDKLCVLFFNLPDWSEMWNDFDLEWGEIELLSVNFVVSVNSHIYLTRYF